MIVERIWTGNAYRNYNYLIACPESGEALAIDPLDHEKCLNAARVKGWQITQVLNTHEHHDHTGGNATVVAATGAKLIAHHRAGARIPGVDRGVKAGDVIKVGKTVELECLDTPGHTYATSACARTPTSPPFSPATRCSMPAPATATTAATRKTCMTFVEQLAKLPENTRVYPGTTTSRTTCASRSRASPTTPPPRRCCRR
jgi:hydroxyacylglutathione hydrolase